MYVQVLSKCLCAYIYIYMGFYWDTQGLYTDSREYMWIMINSGTYHFGGQVFLNNYHMLSFALRFTCVSTSQKGLNPKP